MEDYNFGRCRVLRLQVFTTPWLNSSKTLV
jgi:hypothetical protein